MRVIFFSPASLRCNCTCPLKWLLNPSHSGIDVQATNSPASQENVGPNEENWFAFLSLPPILRLLRQESPLSNVPPVAAGLRSSAPLECPSRENTALCTWADGKPRTACWIITSFAAEAAGGEMMSEWKSPRTPMWAEGTKTNTEKTGQCLNLFQGWSAQECLTIFCLVNRFHFLMAVLVSGKQNCRMESGLLLPPPRLLWLSGTPSGCLRRPASCRMRWILNSHVVFRCPVQLSFLLPK